MVNNNNQLRPLSFVGKKTLITTLMAATLLTGCEMDLGGADESKETDKEQVQTNPDITQAESTELVVLNDMVSTTNGKITILSANVVSPAMFSDVNLGNDFSALQWIDYDMQAAGFAAPTDSYVTNSDNYFSAKRAQVNAIISQIGARGDTLADRVTANMQGPVNYTIHDVKFTTKYTVADVRQILLNNLTNTVTDKASTQSTNSNDSANMVVESTADISSTAAKLSKYSAFRLMTSHVVVDGKGYVVVNTTPLTNYDPFVVKYSDLNKAQTVLFK